MSPQAESPDLTVAAEDLVPSERLEDGEVVLLAVKPSRWLALVVSWPVLLVAAVVAAGACVAVNVFAVAVNDRLIVLFCIAVACTRVTLGCLQWLGRLYVLTNRRVMRLSGVGRQSFRHCPLVQIENVHLAATLPERAIGAGSLLFQCREGPADGPGDWACLSEPREVLRAVEEAWNRAA